MKSLNDILWGDQLENSDNMDQDNDVDSGIMPMMRNTLAMCCGLGNPCNSTGSIPCASGHFGCR